MPHRHRLLTIPIEVRLPKKNAAWTIKDSDGQAFLQCIFEPQPEAEEFLDGWNIRDRFLRVRRNQSDLLKFLMWVGRFPPVIFAGDYALSLMWKWQDLFRDALLRKNLDWKEDFIREVQLQKKLGYEMGSRAIPHPFLFSEEFSHSSVSPRAEVQFLWVRKKPTAVVYPTCGLYAIGSTVELDLVRGAEFRWCARPDCPKKIFQPASRRQRKYCSYECAHLQSIRNKRVTIVASEADE